MRPRSPLSATAWLAGGLLAACASPEGGPSGAPSGRAPGPGPGSAPSLSWRADRSPGRDELPVDWRGSSPATFERLVLALQDGPPPTWSPEALTTLAHALEASDEGSVRAVVLLAHDPSPAVEDLLLTRLESRRTPGRAWVAADLVAATELGRRPTEPAGPASTPPRLVALVQGERPHPDLEVRVECAASALRLGREEVVPFLVRVLRARTPAEAEDPPDWERVDTLAWAKWRAAQALAEGLGEPDTFRADGSWQHQVERARHLEEAYARRAAERAGGPVDDASSDSEDR